MFHDDLLKDSLLKYGKGNDIQLKRTISSACAIVEMVAEAEDFVDLEIALYVKCNDETLLKLMRNYESQLELAYLSKMEFIGGLHYFYLNVKKFIEQNKLLQELINLCKILTCAREKKCDAGYGQIIGAYISLIMQQLTYFAYYRDTTKDYEIVGYDGSGGLMLQESAYPFVDVPFYGYHAGKYGLEIVVKEFIKAGYKITSFEDLEFVQACFNLQENNNHIMLPFINERTEKFIVKNIYNQNAIVFPREWKPTDFYIEKLKSRQYMLPVTGIQADFVNAGDINTLHLMEVFQDDGVYLIYRLITQHSGELAGYYNTTDGESCNIFKHTARTDYFDSVLNFVLENYMILACDYVIDKKRNYALLVTEESNVDYFPKQPVVRYLYKHKCKSNGSTNRYYRKSEYVEEIKSKAGFIRRLPAGQKASQEAIGYAKSLGYNLSDGKTFVRAHEFKVYKRLREVN